MSVLIQASGLQFLYHWPSSSLKTLHLGPLGLPEWDDLDQALEGLTNRMEVSGENIW